MPPKRVTVRELIAALKCLKTPDAVVSMASDPEGNDIRFLSALSIDSATAVSLWPGERDESDPR